MSCKLNSRPNAVMFFGADGAAYSTSPTTTLPLLKPMAVTYSDGTNADSGQIAAPLFSTRVPIRANDCHATETFR
jgi:hypothetical protein